ncbi:type VI secretion system tip protein VgrG [Rubrivivax gelatinosus]|nr:type VI secretion system tip protein VgrG [Rubrivivax gelatinosus]
MTSPSPFTLSTPLPPGRLRFLSMSYGAALGALEQTQLQLLSEDADIEAEKLLGQPVGVAVAMRDGQTRHFHGLVARLGITRHTGRWHGYSAELRPWLWFLTRTADCRIFQDLAVPDILEQVFKDHAAIARYELQLERSYRKRSYCVQYRETDFNFVARLMEDEGIYWYFEHGPDEHRLMIVDAPAAHRPVDGDQAAFPFFDGEGQIPPDVEYVTDWRCSRGVRPGKVALTSYDFERPSTPLLVTQSLARQHPQAEQEIFDFQGDYTIKGDGQQLVDDRLDEQQCRYDTASGRSNAQALACGRTFELQRHPRGDQNTRYLCTQLQVLAQDQPGESAAGAAGDLQCSFDSQRADVVFRPARRTPKPFVQGPQTALVVGPQGEEIFTDKYGRVKLQFHWDRRGQKNEKSSCWVRVSSPWAGKSFGFVQVPRIGQEVVVDFLEGDPDQPLITGRVYNAEQMPPWELPANATQSGVLSRSSKGGGYANANALRFEDKKGSEQLWLHAEKNQDIEVENDESHWVGHDRTKTVDHDETTQVKHDRTETVGNNETITIGVDRGEKVGSNESITIGANRSEQVGANETISIGSNRSITVGGSETATVALQRTHAVGVNETIAIGAAQEVAIGAAQVVAVGAAQTITIGANQSTSVGVDQSTQVGARQSTDVGTDRSISVGANQSLQVGKNRSAQVGQDDALKVGKNLVIDAGDSVTIKTGSASITMKKDGTIVVKGKDITLDGSGKIKVKASGDVVIKGSKVGVN